MSDIKRLIDTMVCSIVDDTVNVQLEEEDTGSGILFTVTVSKGDVGKLIGKGGRVASALRTVAKAAGAKLGTRILINVMNKPLDE